MGNNWFAFPSTPKVSLLKDKPVTKIFTAAFQKVKTSPVFGGHIFRGLMYQGILMKFYGFNRKVFGLNDLFRSFNTRFFSPVIEILS